MGKVKYIPGIMEFFKRTPVVSTRDVKLYLRQKGYSYLLLSNLVKRKAVKRITKSFYTIHDDPIVSIFCFKPAYLGLQEALSIHNLWEQESNVVIVTSKKVRIGLREMLRSNVIVHRVKPRYLFGFDLVKYGDFFVPVSDVEKTLLDFVYLKEPLGRGVISIMKREANVSKMRVYMKRYPRWVRMKVKKLGFG